MAHGSAEKNQCKLAVMFTLNFSFFLVELVVGYLTKSMALVADSFHMLSDVAALVVAFFAVRMSPKKWSRNTYGFARAEVLGALVNSVFLLALCFSITIDSIKRIVKPEELENPPLILIVGTIGLIMNLVGLCIFRDHGHSHGHGHSHSHDSSIAPLERKRSTMVHQNRLTHMMRASVGSDDDANLPGPLPVNHHHHPVTLESPSDETVNQNGSKKINFKSKPKKGGAGADQMNIRGVFLHLLADALGSVIVLVSALVVWLTSWEYKDYVDPCMSIAMVILITCSSIPLLVESSMILLQSVPEHIDIEEIEKKLLRQIDGVIGVHELHVWQLTGDTIIATAHIKCTNIEEYFEIAEKVKAVFHNEGIHSTTIQPEFSQQSPAPGGKDDTGCFLSCAALSTTSNCAANTCCPPTPDKGLVEAGGTTRKARQ